MVTYFMGCCPLRMAVRNISIYTAIICVFDTYYILFNRNEIIVPPSVIYKYPSGYTSWEITWLLLILQFLLVVSAIPLFLSTVMRNSVLILPYLAIQIAKVMSECLLLVIGVFFAPWNFTHFKISLLLFMMRTIIAIWDFYLMATVYSFLILSKY